MPALDQRGMSNLWQPSTAVGAAAGQGNRSCCGSKGSPGLLDRKGAMRKDKRGESPGASLTATGNEQKVTEVHSGAKQLSIRVSGGVQECYLSLAE